VRHSDEQWDAADVHPQVHPAAADPSWQRQSSGRSENVRMDAANPPTTIKTSAQM